MPLSGVFVCVVALIVAFATTSGGVAVVDEAIQEIGRAGTTAMPATVSASAYRRVATGMSYGEVARMIGHAGEELSRSYIEGVPGVMPDMTTVMYAWVNADGSSMNAMFQNDELVQKAQFGLQ